MSIYEKRSDTLQFSDPETINFQGEGALEMADKDLADKIYNFLDDIFSRVSNLNNIGFFLVTFSFLYMSYNVYYINDLVGDRDNFTIFGHSIIISCQYMNVDIDQSYLLTYYISVIIYILSSMFNLYYYITGGLTVNLSFTSYRLYGEDAEPIIFLIDLLVAANIFLLYSCFISEYLCFR